MDNIKNIKVSKRLGILIKKYVSSIMTGKSTAILTSKEKYISFLQGIWLHDGS